MNEADKRTHARAQYFLIRDAGQIIPIYAFRDPDDLFAIPALIIDMSDGGLQVLTANTTELSQQIYNLELVVGPNINADSERVEILMIWSRNEGVNVRSGFAFSHGARVGAKCSEILQDAPHHLVRCVLHPA